MLSVAGRLDTRLGGRGSQLEDNNLRRAVYGYTDRFRIPALLRNFDVANPDTSISKRTETLVPLQSLYLMNSTFVRQQALALTRRPEFVSAATMRERIAAAFRLVLARAPRDDEMQLAIGYMSSAPLDGSGAFAWPDLIQGLLLSNEFVFVD